MEHTEAMENLEKTSSKIKQNLKSMISSVEKVLEDGTVQCSDACQNAKAKLASTLEDAKFAIREAEEAIVNKARHAAEHTAEYVKEHPWQAAGIAAGIGFLLGMLIARK